MENIIKRNVAAGRKITFGRRKRENYQEQISTQLRERDQVAIIGIESVQAGTNHGHTTTHMDETSG